MSPEKSNTWLDHLVGEHLDAFYRYALRLCHGRAADAEDLIQDAMLRAVRCADQLKDLEAGRAWLFQIVTRTHLNRVRARGRRAETVSSDLGEAAFEEALASWTPIEGPEESLIRQQEHDVLIAAIDALDPGLRSTLWLSDLEGFPQREVATMLGVAEGTVSSRLFRARRALRGSLTGAKQSAPARTRRIR